MSWTSERVEILKTMWSEGKSASQIAGELGGVTRNAVIGKIHRLGLSNRGNVSGKEKLSATTTSKQVKLKSSKPTDSKTSNGLNKPSVSRKPITNKANDNAAASESVFVRPNKNLIFSAGQPLPPQPSSSEISAETLENVKSLEKNSKKLSLMDLTERTCKWPIGDPATEDFWFCGHPAEQGKPYCETHIEIAFQPVTARRDRKAR